MIEKNKNKLRLVISDESLIKELLDEKININDNSILLHDDCRIFPLNKYQPTYSIIAFN